MVFMVSDVSCFVFPFPRLFFFHVFFVWIVRQGFSVFPIGAPEVGVMGAVTVDEPWGGQPCHRDIHGRCPPIGQEACADGEDLQRRRLAKRVASIDVIKATKEYLNYVERVPREQRELHDPMTPNPEDRKLSTRKWKCETAKWHRSLHATVMV